MFVTVDTAEGFSGADGVAGAGRETAGILHADLDAFFASVEQRDDPALRGRPVLVGGGVIVAASYEAKAFGIKTPTNERAAKRRCPNAVVVPPRFEAYLEASKAVFTAFRNVTPFVEGISIDEAFLDVRGAGRLLGTPEAIATQLRATVREDIGLPVSVGIATTKFLAKVASVSAKPDGICLVPAGRELEFLHPLPVERLWGVGPKTTERLHALGIMTVGEMARIPDHALASTLGRAHAAHLHAISWNRDPRRVRAPARRRSIGSQSALGRPRRGVADLDAVLLAIVDRVARRLRADDRLARTITVRLRLGDSERITRSVSVEMPTDLTEPIVDAARELLAKVAPIIEERGCTLIGLACSNLVARDPLQLSLPFPRAGRTNRALDLAVDDLQARFGNAVITRASLVDDARLRHSFAEPLYERAATNRTRRPRDNAPE